MYIKKRKLADGRTVGCAVFEIASFPNLEEGSQESTVQIEQMYQHFTHIVQEFFKFGQNADAVAELLWITEKAERQTFQSRIRMFCVVRKIDSSPDVVEASTTQIANHLQMSFTTKQYRTNSDSFDNYLELLGHVDKSCLFSVVKAEKCAGNAMSIYPYYYCDVIPAQNADNFASIVSTLSQQKNCCISFQLLPTRLTGQEQVFLNEVTGELGRISTGFIAQQEMYVDVSAKEPYTVLSSYQSKMNAPLYTYNILIFGTRNDCTGLAAKIVSLLQSGKKRIMNPDFVQVDLSAESVNLTENYLNYPWNINNKLIYNYRNTQLFERVAMAKVLFRLPYIITAEEAAAFFRLPIREKSMAALESNQTNLNTEMFDESVLSEDNIHIGKLISHDKANVLIGCPDKAFTKHAMIVGMPGTGKTTFSVNLLMQFFRKGIPFLAIEPTKHEYRAMLDVISELQVFTPGKNDVSPFIINPFIPPKGIKLEQYVPSLATAFQAAFSMQQPLDMLFLRAIRICYAQYGWKDYSAVGDADVTVFGLYEFIRVFKKLVDDTNYEAKIKGNLQSAGVLRLMNLIEQNSNIYDTINTVPIEDILVRPTVLELNAIENDEQKSLLMALLLISICTYTKHNHKTEGRLQNIILIDEAHVLFGSKIVSENEANPINTTTKALQDMVAEIRSYGTGIIIADQTPSKIGREILACTDIKVAFRLVEESERKLLSGSIDLSTSAVQQLARLDVGEGFFYFSRLKEPQLLKTPDVREDESIRLDVSDDEVAAKMDYWDSRQSMLVPFSECQFSASCNGSCDFKIRADAEHYAIRYLREYGAKITDVKLLRQFLILVDEWLITRQGFTEDTLNNRLSSCLKIRMLRKALLERDISASSDLSNKVLKSVLEV